MNHKQDGMNARLPFAFFHTLATRLVRLICGQIGGAREDAHYKAGPRGWSFEPIQACVVGTTPKEQIIQVQQF